MERFLNILTIILALVVSVTAAHAQVTAPPTCTITSPGAGTISGRVNLTVTISGPIAGTSGIWQVTDGTNILSLSNNITTAPFSSTWDTSKIVDGTYTIQFIPTNVGGATGSACSVAVATSNGVTAETYAFSSAGSDSNPCTVAQPCASATKFNSLTYHGGDTIEFDAGHAAITTTQPLLLCGGNAYQLNNGGRGGNIIYPAQTSCRQNVYPGIKQLTVTSYNAGGLCVALAGPINCAGLTQSGLYNLLQVINLSNVTVQNLALSCDISLIDSSAGTTALNIGAESPGIIYWPRNQVVQNNYITGCVFGIYARNAGAYGMYNNLMQNNQITETAPTVHGQSGIFLNFGGNSWNVVGNLISNIGANPSTGNTLSVGIEIGNSYKAGVSSSFFPTLVEFNVVHDFDYYNHTCGGGAGIETYNVSNVTIQNNEVYNGGSATATGCDAGGIDLDAGTWNGLAQYNYTHNNWGWGYLLYESSTIASFPGNWQGIARFNISENDQRGSGNVGCGICLGNGQGGLISATVLVYNNTIYADNTGLYGSTTYTGIGVSNCPLTGSLVANNIVDVGKNPADSTNRMVIISTGGYGNCTAANNANYILTFKANDYFASGASPSITWPNVATTLANWQAAVGGGDTGATTANPVFSGTPPVGTCYPGGGAAPGGPQNTPSAGCPAAYTLGSGSPLLNQAYTGIPSSTGLLVHNPSITQDYYRDACSGSNVHHIGASACQ